MNDKRRETTITVPVDPYNPGEFLACCGLLELAHRLTAPGCRALGWFSRSDGGSYSFSISAFDGGDPVTLERVIDSLGKSRIEKGKSLSKEGPVLLEGPFNITLDWRRPFPQNGKIKTFAGTQELFTICQTLHQAVQTFEKAELSDSPLFGIRKSTAKEVTAFGIERAENVIDAGFSMDTQKGRLVRETSVFLELLALIGAQRFCPGDQKPDLVYYCWDVPLIAPLAAIAASIPLNPFHQEGFVFQTYKRDPKGYYKGFKSAQRVKTKKGGNR